MSTSLSFLLNECKKDEKHANSQAQNHEQVNRLVAHELLGWKRLLLLQQSSCRHLHGIHTIIVSKFLSLRREILVIQSKLLLLFLLGR